jgi:hypothetical protein
MLTSAVSTCAVPTCPGVFLTDANVTQEQIDQAKSLEGATMPNGQKYEDCLKDKERRGNDGENGGPS